MDFDFRHLEVFCKVVELGSFSRAARAVSLSQASVSERIAALERSVGTKLLDRLARNIVPTKAGTLLYQRALEHLQMKRQTCLELGALLDVHRGAIEMGGSTIPGEYILPGAIRRFRQDYPEVAVSVVIGDTETISDMISEGELELGVVGAADRAKHLAYNRLWKDEMVLVVPASHPWAKRKTVTFDELCKQPFILREPGSGTRCILEQHLEKAGRTRLRDLEVAAQFGSSTAVKEGIKRGLGLSILSSTAVADDVEAGLLKTLAVRGLPLWRSFYLVRDKRRTQTPLTRCLARFLVSDASSG